MTNILEIIKPLCVRITPVGSRVTCNPPPTDTDADYLCHVKLGAMRGFRILAEQCGAELGGSDCGEGELSSDFCSFTLGETNIIATESHYFSNRFLAATSVAKRLNLLDKDDRIALFQAVLYGNF